MSCRARSRADVVPAPPRPRVADRRPARLRSSSSPSSVRGWRRTTRGRSLSIQPNPSSHHWLGPDELGQDIWSQPLVGARPTIVVAFVAGTIATLLSVVIGVTGGLSRRPGRRRASMLANIFLVLPALPLLIVIGSFLPRRQSANSVLIGVIIALTGWAWGARVLRAQTMSLRNRDFVESPPGSSESALARHLARDRPRTWRPYLASSFLFTVLYAIGTYVALGFLGCSNPSVNWSWGSMLFGARRARRDSSGEWWWFLPPGICIALVGTSWHCSISASTSSSTRGCAAPASSRKAAKVAGVAS